MSKMIRLALQKSIIELLSKGSVLAYSDMPSDWNSTTCATESKLKFRTMYSIQHGSLIFILVSTV